MYLLKHATGAPTNSIIEFTFHYVSIKTMKILFFTLYLLHLHSTMYLLKLPAISKITSFYSVFTFHYVSIKTKTRLSVRSIQNYLHSTMYLLKPDITDDNYLTEYDLHSTMYLLKQFRSVNVAIQLVYLHSTMYLLKLSHQP